MRKQFIEYLNEINVPSEDLKSNGGRIPDHIPYGNWLSRNDVIAFNLEFNNWKRDNLKK